MKYVLTTLKWLNFSSSFCHSTKAALFLLHFTPGWSNMLFLFFFYLFFKYYCIHILFLLLMDLDINQGSSKGNQDIKLSYLLIKYCHSTQKLIKI